MALVALEYPSLRGHSDGVHGGHVQRSHAYTLHTRSAAPIPMPCIPDQVSTPPSVAAPSTPVPLAEALVDGGDGGDGGDTAAAPRPVRAESPPAPAGASGQGPPVYGFKLHGGGSRGRRLRSSPEHTENCLGCFATFPHVVLRPPPLDPPSPCYRPLYLCRVYGERSRGHLGCCSSLLPVVHDGWQHWGRHRRGPRAQCSGQSPSSVHQGGALARGVCACACACACVCMHGVYVAFIPSIRRECGVEGYVCLCVCTWVYQSDCLLRPLGRGGVA
jgi:hypothetical protein